MRVDLPARAMRTRMRAPARDAWLAPAAMLALVGLYVLALGTGAGRTLDAAVMPAGLRGPAWTHAHEALQAAVDVIIVAILVLVATLVLAIALVRDGTRFALRVGLLLAGASLTSYLLKPLLGSADLFGGDQLRAIHHSFPSGQATVALAVAYAALTIVPGRWRAVCAVLAAAYVAAVGVGVMMIHAHYPSDVIGGYLVATAWAAGTQLLARRQRPAEQRDLRCAGAPDGTVTVMFSDIEDSARLAERLGDRRWLDLLGAHDAILRGQVAGHGGYEVKSQGDGFMLAFPSARRAVMCAIDIQRALARRGDADGLPLRVGIGIHTGEAIHRQGDFYGKSVILAARIAEQARGDEIVISSLVRELTEAAGDLRFNDAGETELKGLEGRHRLHRVVWRGSQPRGAELRGAAEALAAA